MVIAIFRSRLRSEYEQEYRETAPRMLESARASRGFRSFKTFSSEDGERLSIIEFETHDDLLAWRDDPDHKEVQGLGRERFYSEYHIQICDPIRSYSWEDGVRKEHS